jgi:hypothetical protein
MGMIDPSRRQLATANALVNTKESPPPFNRHGMQHGIPAFFNGPAMLAGGLVMTGCICELAWLAEHCRDVWKKRAES